MEIILPILALVYISLVVLVKRQERRTKANIEEMRQNYRPFNLTPGPTIDLEALDKEKELIKRKIAKRKKSKKRRKSK